MNVSIRGEELLGEFVHVRGEVGVGERQEAALGPVSERRAVLEGQRVGGDVFGVEIHDALEGGFPRGESLFGEGVDKVEVQVIESCLPRPLD